MSPDAEGLTAATGLHKAERCVHDRGVVPSSGVDGVDAEGRRLRRVPELSTPTLHNNMLAESMAEKQILASVEMLSTRLLNSGRGYWLA